MRTTILLNQHKRCECILEMIEKCEIRIAVCKESIALHKEKQINKDAEDWYYHRWQITLAVKERLISAYSNALKKIVSPVINKIIA